MWDRDETKRRANRAKHGVDFADVARFDWDHATTDLDGRADYGELRFVSTSTLDGRLHVCVWTERNGRVRIIGLRKANARERRRHEQGTKKLH